MAPASISIIVPLFNKSAYVAETLRALLDQLGERDELIVVDDVSTDDSVNRVMALRSPRIRLLRSEVNGGPSSARNAGAEAANGSHLLFFDADDIPQPHLLTTLRDVISRHQLEHLFSFGIAI